MAAPQAPTLPALLHRHGTAGTWGNLGLWPARDYAAACSALACAVGRAAGLGAGQRVLSVACGAGDELALWVGRFGVAHATGVEPDGTAVALARRHAGPQVQLQAGSLASLPAAAGSFDAVLCVDAAYHLAPRSDFIARAHTLLRPGGRLAFTDLVLDGRAGLLLRAAARLCGVPRGDLGPSAQRVAELQAAGFDTVRCERLDDAVLGGFVRFAAQQRRRLGAEARGPGWRRVAVTARLIPPCRAAGLGYALYAARKP